jgi:hypothetical protein
MLESSGRFPSAQKTATLGLVSTSRFYRVPLEQIAYVRAIVDGYDGVLQVRADGADRGEIELVAGTGLEDEADAILRRLGDETGMVEIARPADWRTPAGPR